MHPTQFAPDDPALKTSIPTKDLKAVSRPKGARHFSIDFVYLKSFLCFEQNYQDVKLQNMSNNMFPSPICNRCHKSIWHLSSKQQSCPSNFTGNISAIKWAADIQ